MTCLSGSSGSDWSRGIIGIGMRMSVFQWRIRSQTSTADSQAQDFWMTYCLLLLASFWRERKTVLETATLPCSWEKSPWCDDLWVPNFPISTCHAPRQSPEAALALAEEELAKAKQVEPVEPAEHGASFWAPSGNLFETSQTNSLTVTNRLPLATTDYHWLPLAYHESLAAKPELLYLDTKLKFSLGSQHYVLAVFGWLSAFFVQWIRC